MSDTMTVPLAVAGKDLVPVLVWTTADQALWLQEHISRLMIQQAAAVVDGGTYRPPHANTYGPKDAWELPAWTGTEEDAAAWIIDVLGPRQRRVLAAILAAGPDGIWTGELRRRAGYEESVSLSGVFKAIGGRFRSTGFRPVWNGGEKDSQKGQRLRVLEQNAGLLFRRVMKTRHPELAAEFGM